MKYIKVSGCGNCPYLTVWNDGNGNGVDSICAGTCGHPSFNNQLGHARMDSNVFFNNRKEEDFKSLIADGAPEWCPLPD